MLCTLWRVESWIPCYSLKKNINFYLFSKSCIIFHVFHKFSFPLSFKMLASSDSVLMIITILSICSFIYLNLIEFLQISWLTGSIQICSQRSLSPYSVIVIFNIVSYMLHSTLRRLPYWLTSCYMWCDDIFRWVAGCQSVHHREDGAAMGDLRQQNSQQVGV